MDKCLKVCAVFFLLIGLIFSNNLFAQEKAERIIFTLPSQWQQIGNTKDGRLVFTTDKNFNSAVIFFMRKFLADQNPMEWAIDEANGIRQNRMKIIEGPVGITCGKLTWIKLVSEGDIADKEGGVLSAKSEQYFLKSPEGTFIEVNFAGDKKSFLSLDSKKVGVFLSSLRFTRDSLENVKKQEYTKYVAEKAANSVKYNKGDIIKGFLAVESGDKAPESDAKLDNSGKYPFIPEIRILIDGKTVAAETLTPFTYKIISIKDAKSQILLKGKKVDLYEVILEVLDVK